jgi:hypothetical protein
MSKNNKIAHIPKTKRIEIIFLLNALYYFIDWAIIINEAYGGGEGYGYRLLVYHKDRLTTDKRYESPEDAIKDFREIYKDLERMDRYEPQWSFPYDVEISWVNKKLRYARLWPFIKKIINYIHFKIEYLIVKFGWERR